MSKLQSRKIRSTARAAEMGEKAFPAAPANQKGIEGDTLARRAFELWLERGCPEGSPEEDWYRAEKELGTVAKPMKRAGDVAAAPEPMIQRAGSGS